MENLDLEIIEKVHEALKKKGVKVTLAESCTAGLVAHALTLMPGASGCFDSSVVCYSRHAKHRLLGLSESFLDKHGTVSEDTARAMAEAARKKAGTEVAMAVTGVLGPEPVEDRKVGIVFIAVAVEGQTTSRGFSFEGDRNAIKYSAANQSLHFLYEAVSVWA
jgi:nicotinamide-nucleotide amidase